MPVALVTDLEGVLFPEIWIAVLEKTGIDKLRLTTRDVPDYDQLARGRLEILEQKEFPQYHTLFTYKEMRQMIERYMKGAAT
ncbi:MAG: hypothetical protein AMS17_05985 [Spirochaetes bacterium DG_61]|jgi:hypothetical protein|nr:MAG: hypothetical protein AMS17_05985 [Spirochaetes bacterium DG_61]